jgi:hypothetical protein
MKFPGFVGPSYQSQSRRLAAQRCVNWYVENIEVQDETFGSALYPTPGCEERHTFVESPVRGMLEHNGRCFVAVGQTFYEIYSDKTTTPTVRGTIAYATTPVMLVANDMGDEVFITSAGVGYIFTLSTDAFATVLASGADQGAFLDGFFLSLNDSTSTLRLSDLNDGTTWDATQYAQRTAGADPWQAVVVTHRDIWLFGKQTTEVWYNAGTSPFPFAAIPGAFLEQGIVAPYSAKRLGNTVMWLGSSDDGAGVVWMASGYSPQRISTHAVEYAIQGYVRAGISITDAVAWTYQEDGHNFYGLNFPSAKATWVFDSSTGLWHERGTWNIEDVEYKAWRPQYHVYAFNKHLVGDRAIGTVYEMSIEKFTEAGGGPIRRLRRTPHVAANEDWMFYNSVQVELETGLGLTTGQGSDPQVMLRWSDDGGETWGHERWASAGKRGNFGVRTIWRRLGRGYDRVYEIAVTDPIPWRVIGAYVDFKVTNR